MYYVLAVLVEWVQHSSVLLLIKSLLLWTAVLLGSTRWDCATNCTCLYVDIKHTSWEGIFSHTPQMLQLSYIILSLSSDQQSFHLHLCVGFCLYYVRQTCIVLYLWWCVFCIFITCVWRAALFEGDSVQCWRCVIYSHGIISGWHIEVTAFTACIYIVVPH